MSRSSRLSLALAFLIVLFGASSPRASLMADPAWVAEGDQEEAWFGVSVGTAGDVNGDGFSDVIVGAYLYDNGETDEGRAFVYHGSAGGLSTTPAWTAESNKADAWFGYSVGAAGDVNGDGFSDVVVGAWQYTDGENQEGRAFVYHGSLAGLSTSPTWTFESNQAGAQLGFSVAGAGDVNGDGFSDVIVGAWHYGDGQNHEGRALVFHGSAGGLASTPSWAVESNQADAYFGTSVGTAGDVNDDGFSDVIVGAEGYDNGQIQEGGAFVFHGSAGGLATSAAWTFESNHIGGYLGNAVGTGGDVNGDGFSDVIVGSYLFDNGSVEEGRVYAFHGSAAGLSTSPNWTVEGNLFAAYLGTSVGTAGDVNDDGFSDAIVGAFLYENGLGQAFVYYGSSSGLSSSADWTPASFRGGQFGISVGTAGDVNGDDFPEVVIGAWEHSGDQFNEGRALVYRGAGEATSVDNRAPAPPSLELEEPTPNPFADEAELSYALPEKGQIRLNIFDLAGRRVATMAEGVEEAGRHTVRWSARSNGGERLSPGVYLARLEFSGQVVTRKIVLAR